MKNESSDALIETALIEKDSSLLLAAPLIVQEVQRRHVTVVEFFDLLKQGLAEGMTAEGWLQEASDKGQLAIAKRLLPHIDGASANELRRLSREWRERCIRGFTRVQDRLKAQQMVLSDKIVSELEEMLSDASQLIEESWFNLALEHIAEIERLLDFQMAEAIKERQDRFEKAQRQIMEVRRQFLYSEAVVRQNKTSETVWELLGYADRLSASVECDLERVEKLCSAIKELYQGAPVDQTLLPEFRSLLSRAGGKEQSVPATLTQQVEQTVPPTEETLNSITLRLQHEPLSAAVRALLDELVSENWSILHFEVSNASMLPGATWNEIAAKEALSRARALSLRLVRDLDESSAASELLKVIRYLLSYWGEKRKKVPESVSRELADSLLGYIELRSSSLLRAGHWDAACEYYRAAFRLYARRGRLIGAERLILNYLTSYATHEPVSEEYYDQLTGLVELGSNQWLLVGLKAGLEWSADDASPRLVQGLVKLAAEDPWLLEVVQNALSEIQDDVLRRSLVSAARQVGQHWNVDDQQVPLAQLFHVLVNAYTAARKCSDDLLNQLLDMSNSIRSWGDLRDVLGQLQATDCLWEPTDQKLLSSLGAMANSLSRYLISELPFEERERLVESLLQQEIPAITRLVLSSPTRLGIVYVHRAADNLHLALEEDYISLRRVSLPAIEVKVEQSEWRSDELYYCHLDVSNFGDMRAEKVRLQIKESPVGEYRVVDEKHELETLYPGQPRFMHVRVRPTLLDDTQNTFTLCVELQYQVPHRDRSEVRALRLRVDNFVAQRPKFRIIKNPYVVGGPVRDPKLFLGRWQLIKTLLLEVANPDRTGSVVIFGQKRSGKTSLLYHLAQSAQDSAVTVLFDIPTILADLPQIDVTLPVDQRQALEEDMLGRFMLALARRIVRECQMQGMDVAPISWDELMDKPGPSFQFRQFLEQFRGRPDNRRLLLLFDEFTTLMDKVDKAIIDGTIMRLLKSLIEHGYFSCIICGLTEVYEAVKRYANQLAVSQPVQVDYLEYEPASDLIQVPTRMPDGHSRFYSQQVVDEIIELTAGSPYYIQMFCHRLVDYMNKMQIERVTVADIDAVMRSLIEGGERIDLVHFDNLYRYKDSPGQDDRDAILEGLVMHLLAHETATKPYTPASAIYRRIQEFVTEDELDHVLGELEQRRTIIQQIDDPVKARRTQQPLRARHYRIRVDLFRRWLLANQPLDEEAIKSFERRLQQ